METLYHILILTACLMMGQRSRQSGHRGIRINDSSFSCFDGSTPAALPSASKPADSSFLTSRAYTTLFEAYRSVSQAFHLAIVERRVHKFRTAAGFPSDSRHEPQHHGELSPQEKWYKYSE
ncbi:hypothetical protein L226DRAFT_354808 [Lentinus tigrinus ALCF2SS1-7]|uniref:uncharacterized protein n=1 Tax=Lentinus tigrinus ALCF2SS1-7 TaxID=1328758 RepID=UPI00116627CA|nr:hypothetical protein L226DRAFT_354808 [Lentinus tigrinus ALCF2SS1-7]